MAGPQPKGSRGRGIRVGGHRNINASNGANESRWRPIAQGAIPRSWLPRYGTLPHRTPGHLRCGNPVRFCQPTFWDCPLALITPNPTEPEPKGSTGRPGSSVSVRVGLCRSVSVRVSVFGSETASRRSTLSILSIFLVSAGFRNLLWRNDHLKIMAIWRRISPVRY